MERAKSGNLITWKLEVSQLYKKGKSQIRHWTHTWTKAKGSSKAQKKKRASRHQAQSLKRILPNVCLAATSTDFAAGPQLMGFPQASSLKHISRSCDGLFYPQRSERIFIESPLLSDTELEDSYTLFPNLFSS